MTFLPLALSLVACPSDTANNDGSEQESPGTASEGGASEAQATGENLSDIGESTSPQFEENTSTIVAPGTTRAETSASDASSSESGEESLGYNGCVTRSVSQIPEIEWIYHCGSAGDEIVRGSAQDEDGRVYVTVSFEDAKFPVIADGETLIEALPPAQQGYEPTRQNLLLVFGPEDTPLLATKRNDSIVVGCGDGYIRRSHDVARDLGGGFLHEFASVARVRSLPEREVLWTVETHADTPTRVWCNGDANAVIIGAPLDEIVPQVSDPGRSFVHEATIVGAEDGSIRVSTVLDGLRRVTDITASTDGRFIIVGEGQEAGLWLGLLAEDELLTFTFGEAGSIVPGLVTVSPSGEVAMVLRHSAALELGGGLIAPTPDTGAEGSVIATFDLEGQPRSLINTPPGEIRTMIYGADDELQVYVLEENVDGSHELAAYVDEVRQWAYPLPPLATPRYLHLLPSPDGALFVVMLVSGDPWIEIGGATIPSFGGTDFMLFRITP